MNLEKYDVNGYERDLTRFHGDCPGMKDRFLARREKNKINYIDSRYCTDHDVICSKSGWEYGWFDGTYSKAIPGSIPDLDKYLNQENVKNLFKNHTKNNIN